MKIRMRTIWARGKETILPGTELDVPAKQAKELLSRGFAEPVRGQEVERAVKSSGEMAVEPRA